MKRFFSLLGAVALVAGLGLTACGGLVPPPPSATPAPTATVAPATPTAVILPTPQSGAQATATVEPLSTPTAASFPGTAVSFDRLSLVLPAGVATSGSGVLVEKAEGENIAPWEVAPAHLQFTLEGYAVQNKLHQPQIYVYPAEAYAQVQQNGAAAQSLERLRAVLAHQAGESVTKQELPSVPFFNAAQMIASHIKVVAFQNGRGVRVLTQYAQGLVPINNSEMIYHFEGLTNDGQYYVIAILPVTAPGLSQDATPGASVPEGGVPMPDLNSANPDMAGYYANVQQLLEGLQPGAFTPNLDQLDALIGSLNIVTPK